MAMEPVLLICGGCGVRIRTTDPARARGRSCPRCESSLDPAVDRALIVEVEPAEAAAGPDLEAATSSNSPALRWTAGVAVVFSAIAIGVILGLAGRSPSPEVSPAPASIKPPFLALQPTSSASSSTANHHDPVDPTEEPDETDVPSKVADLTPPPPSPQNDLAILEPAPNGRDARTILKPPVEDRSKSTTLESQPPPPPSSAVSTNLASAPSTEPRRLRVRDQGRAMVAREHGVVKDRLTVLLPDGRIGWPEGQVFTHEPFVPSTMEQMKQALREDPEFAAFRLVQTTHYLILYQGTSDSFARASGDLLEKLHDGLTGVLKKNGLPVQPMEFPLVAVIFATEADFRANRQVAPDVQAYYEILSNRIYFYEKSKRDQDAPEVSALRKPQTVAHEGTHQILHNIGLQPRMSNWPLWLVEGLAEYCSPPKVTKKGVDWAGLGQVNPLHMATIRDLDEPLPNQFLGANRQPIIARDRRTPLVEYLVTQKELTPTDYALAWALTHYLATKRTADFVTYLKRMSEMKPGVEKTPREQLETFREVFGSDLVQMDGKVAAHLKKVKQPDILPFYAVIFEQQVGATIRRQAMVSQSPSMIRQWLESVALPQGGQPRWEISPQPNRNKAIEVVEHWIRQVQ